MLRGPSRQHENYKHTFYSTIDEAMSGQQIQRSQSSKFRVSPPPSFDDNYINSGISSSLPEPFISSLRQLFSRLDKTNTGYVPFDLFKRYFDCSLSTSELLNELEMKSKSNNYLITFDLLINVIQRSLSTTKQTSLPVTISESTISSIITSKATHSSTLNRSADVLLDAPKKIKKERQIPIVYRSQNELGMKSIPIRIKTKSHQQNNEIDFSMIRALKRFEIERNLLIQTCDALDRVKIYLTERHLEMKDKQKSYCQHLLTAEKTGIPLESLYNRDLVADLFKLANIIIEESNSDYKNSFSSSSSASSLNETNNQYQKELKAKNNYIKQLEIEKRVLLKELVEMRHQQKTVIPMKNS